MDFQDNENKERAVESLNRLFKETTRYFNLEYKLLIYRLLKRGHVKLANLVEDTGLSTTRLYQIIDEVTSLLDKNEAV